MWHQRANSANAINNKKANNMLNKQVLMELENQLKSLLKGEYCQLYLTFNDDAGSYMTVKEAESNGDTHGDWVSEKEKEKGMATNSKWNLQWYPESPVGFCILSASSLPALFEAVFKEKESK
jgi:hypothetical protein